MATYGLKEMGKFLWEGREKGEGKTVNLSARYIYLIFLRVLLLTRIAQSAE